MIEHRDGTKRRAEALITLTADEIDHDGQAVMEDAGANADAPLAVFTILAGAAGDLENGLERAPFPGENERVGVFDRAGVFAFDEEAADVRVLNPPSLHYAQAVVALDGTPTKECGS